MDVDHIMDPKVVYIMEQLNNPEHLGEIDLRGLITFSRKKLIERNLLIIMVIALNIIIIIYLR